MSKTLGWFDNEDGYCIVGTTNIEAANQFHDQLIDEDLKGMSELEEFKSENLDAPQLIFLRPDWESIDDENVDLRLIPDLESECPPIQASAETGTPAFFYRH